MSRPFCFLLENLPGLPDQLVKIDVSLFAIPTRPSAREGQQVVNQFPHPFRGLGNVRQMVEVFFGKRGAGVLLQHLHEAQDMAQRRAQIMRDGITERFQFLVGGLQLRRAFGDALLQFRR